MVNCQSRSQHYNLCSICCNRYRDISFVFFCRSSFLSISVLCEGHLVKMLLFIKINIYINSSAWNKGASWCSWLSECHILMTSQLVFTSSALHLISIRASKLHHTWPFKKKKKKKIHTVTSRFVRKVYRYRFNTVAFLLPFVSYFQLYLALDHKLLPCVEGQTEGPWCYHAMWQRWGLFFCFF